MGTTEMDVSRSGRIRKKSSKLADSLTDEESSTPSSNHQSKAGKLFASPPSDVESYFPEPGEESPMEDLDDLQEADYDIKEEDFDQIPDVVPDRENDDDAEVDVVAGSAIDDDEEGNLEIDESRGQRGAKGRSSGTSIYLAEKRARPSFKSPSSGSGGKKMRKDKGKPRFTAYMLWAKANRDNVVKEITGGNTQPTDFTAVTKRLSEIWSSVPMSEKYQWKKKASKLSYKMARQQVFQAGREAATAAAATSPKPAGTTRLISPPSPIPMPVLRGTSERSWSKIERAERPNPCDWFPLCSTGLDAVCHGASAMRHPTSTGVARSHPPGNPQQNAGQHCLYHTRTLSKDKTHFIPYIVV